MKILIEIPNCVYVHAKEQSEDSMDETTAMRAIANGTPLSTVFDNIINDIEKDSFHDANGVIYCGFTRTRKIIEKYKRSVENGD